MPLALTRRHLLGLSAVSLAGLPRLARGAGLGVAGLQAAGTVRVGCSAAYPPFTSRDDAGGFVGYDVDLAGLIWNANGISVTFVETPWSGVIGALYAKKFDLVMSCMSYTRDRRKWVAFSTPYAEASPVLLIRAADAATIRRLEDLDGKVLGIEPGSIGERLYTQLAEQKHLSYRGVRLFDTQRAALTALAQSKIDATITTGPAAAVVIATTPGTFAMVRGAGAPNWAGIAARPEDTELIEFIDQRLAALKADGRLSQLQEKWFGYRTPLPDMVPDL